MRVQAENPRKVLSPADVALLGEHEALQRLELLATTSRILDTTLEDFDSAMLEVAEVCVGDFADLCAIEVIASDGETRTVAYRYNPDSSLTIPAQWTPIGRRVAQDRKPVLAFDKLEEPDQTRQVRYRLGAQSLIVVPIAGGGLTLGWFVAATSEARRGFRPSALSVGRELASRLSNTIQRATLLREMQASVREQTRTVRRLRRLATAATNLAGAATPEAVLNVACFEACVIHDAGGAVASWTRSDGSVVSASAGQIDEPLAKAAFASAIAGRSRRGPGWVACPLPTSDPWERAALVVFVGEDFATEEELVLSSLASLVPVAFERAALTEAALVHEARLRAVVEGSPVALVGIAADGQVTMANRSAQELFGWTGDPVGRPVEGEIRDAMRGLVREVLSSGGVLNRTATVAERDLSLSGAPLPPGSPNERPGVLVAGLDLSEIRKAERALLQAQRLEAMGQVAGRIAHDFNNVLTLIVGYAELLRRGIGDGEHQTLINNISDASRRAATLTKQMLGMTRKRVDGNTSVDVADAVRDLQDVLARIAGPAVELTVETPDEPVVVGLDPAELEQVLVNLTINACDAMDRSGSISVGVELARSSAAGDTESGPFALLSVVDTGPGMTSEVLARCLEPFFTTKQRGEGTGLGLPTVYGLVTDIGGRLDIESGPGRGTAIRVWMPTLVPGHAPERKSETAAPEMAPKDPGYSDSRHPPSESQPGHVARVLLVEDDLELLSNATKILAEDGFDVVAADSAEQAMGVLNSKPAFDVLVTDVMLPGMSGTRLVSAVREMGVAVAVLYVTSLPAAGGFLSGDPVLAKPYTPDDLRVQVRALAGQVRR
jgi:PAS domain S-box-containing protein